MNTKQMNIYEMLYEPLKINKPIRLIELFAGIGATRLAWNYLGVDVESWKICEWSIKSMQAYKAIHCTEDNTDYSKEYSIDYIKQYLYEKGVSYNFNEPITEEQALTMQDDKARQIYNYIQATHNLCNIQNVKGADLEISDTDKYEYILTYSFPCQDLSLRSCRQEKRYERHFNT